MLPSEFEGRHACCFTGHRPPGLPENGCSAAPEMERLLYLLRHGIESAVRMGVTTFLTGGAEGFDTIAAESVLLLRKQYHPHLRLLLALPSKTQSDAYSPGMQARYAGILEAANSVYYASEADNGAHALLSRNRYLVDHADCCIAYLKNMSGGTLYTVHYALNRGLPVYNLALCDKS